ncbi:MAG: CRTAC1 family protein [Planctomycetota bacterium]|nr:MAG: CRTAC1 family protein [Planctomycetota bacterium]
MPDSVATQADRHRRTPPGRGCALALVFVVGAACLASCSGATNYDNKEDNNDDEPAATTTPDAAAITANASTTTNNVPAPSAALAPPKVIAVDEASRASHQRMVAALAETARRADDEDPYQGTLQARKLRKILAEMPDTAAPRDRWGIAFALGNAEMLLGNTEEAVAHLERAQALLAEVELPPELVTGTRFRLGVAYMRLAEDRNCCQRYSAESCVLPIRGGGIHTDPRGSRAAIRTFLDLLATSPRDRRYYSSLWLLNVAYMTLGDYPQGVPDEYRIEPQQFAAEIEFPQFRRVESRLRVGSFNMAGGAAVDDFDGDGYLDIITSTWDVRGPLQLFRNQRDGTFREQATKAGLDGIVGGLNLITTDYNNDGNLDLLVLRGAWCGEAGQYPNSLLRNNGDGTFSDVTFMAGLGEFSYPTQTAAWADYDLDGDLDVYIGNETTAEYRAACQLFRNNGDGTFSDVAAAAGVTNDRFAKAVVWGDYDDDRDPDLFVSNNGEPNRLYRNNGDGTFTDVARELGVTRPYSSFPAWFWDFDNDGRLDLFASSYSGNSAVVGSYKRGEPLEHEHARLYRGVGGGRFEDVTKSRQLTAPMLPMGSNFGDLDGDGFLDFYLGTGDPGYEHLVPNQLYLNRGGERFVDVTTPSGFGHLQKGHGVAFADLDGDGDLDVFQQMGGAYPGDAFHDAVYENPGFGHHWLTVRLVGRTSNRAAIGVRVQVRLEQPAARSIYRQVGSGGSFGANPLRQTFGLGKSQRVARLEVFWPTTGETQVFEDLPVDQVIEIVEGEPQWRRLDVRATPLATQDR